MTEEAKGYDLGPQKIDIGASSEIGQYAKGLGKYEKDPGLRYGYRYNALPEARVAELEMALKAIRVVIFNVTSFKCDGLKTVEKIVEEALHDSG